MNMIMATVAGNAATLFFVLLYIEKGPDVATYWFGMLSALTLGVLPLIMACAAIMLVGGVIIGAYSLIKATFGGAE